MLGFGVGIGMVILNECIGLAEWLEWTRLIVAAEGSVQGFRARIVRWEDGRDVFSVLKRY